MRVVVSPASRAEFLKSLHDTHIGISRMRALSRSYVWWRGIDTLIEKKVRTCVQCHPTCMFQPKHHYTPRSGQQSRGLIFILTTQDHFLALITWSSSTVIPSGWKLRVSSTTTEPTIRVLQRIFATHQIQLCLIMVLHSLVKSFSVFCKTNGIRHIHSALRHPSTNGLPERAVQVFKSCVKKMNGKTAY